MTKRLLIIGCGRSGTMFVSQLLQQLGFDVRHEEMGEHGMSSWFATSENLTSKRPPLVRHSDFVVLHQVRHPLKAIASMQTIHARAWKLILDHLPEIKLSDGLLTRCMKYWFHWNLMAEEKAVLTYQVEGLDVQGVVGTSKRVNAREHSELTWEDLQRECTTLCKEVREMSVRYRYSD